MPVATIWSAEARMSLSVTLPKKKFQLFHPIGGVCATACGGADWAFSPGTKNANARTASGIATERRMGRAPRGNGSRGNTKLTTWVSAMDSAQLATIMCVPRHELLRQADAWS